MSEIAGQGNDAVRLNWYDPDKKVFRLTIARFGRPPESVDFDREQALALYRAIGKVLGEISD